MLDVTANVAEDSPSARKEEKEINPLKIFRESVTDYCGDPTFKFARIGDQYHHRRIKQSF
tara:strand:+ start:148 stop:327 length:180 start_codon:yes stop_codon:yes gene_type:complete